MLSAHVMFSCLDESFTEIPTDHILPLLPFKHCLFYGLYHPWGLPIPYQEKSQTSVFPCPHMNNKVIFLCLITLQLTNEK